MKKLFLTATLAFFLVSCDNKPKSGQADIKDVSSTPTTSGKTQSNEILQEMQEMMQDMHTKQPTGNNDADFAEMMAEHHEGAIEISEILLRKGTNQELKDFAKKVVQSQTKEKDLMDRFDDLKEKSPDNAAFQKELQASMAPMMNAKPQVHNNLDKDYAAQMIPHHQSAVDMAKVYLKYGKQPELLALSKEIVAAQQKEITFLQNWLSRN